VDSGVGLGYVYRVASRQHNLNHHHIMQYVIMSRTSFAALGNQIGSVMTDKHLAVKAANDLKDRGVLCEVHEFSAQSKDGLSRCVHRNWMPKFRSNLASLRLA
jgi:hypothetical protein